MEHLILQKFHSQITLLLYQMIMLSKNRTKNLIKHLQNDKKLLKDYNVILSKYITEGILGDVTNETYFTNCH